MDDLIYIHKIALTDNGIKYKIYKSNSDNYFYIKRFNGIFVIDVNEDESIWNVCIPLTGGGGQIYLDTSMEV